jgi:pimeloyl-ACP methyl ester carboxylesterase
MKLPRTLLAFTAAATGVVALRRFYAIHEDLDWHTVEKPGRLVDLAGYRVHIVEAGAGPAVILIHGFGGQTYQYRHLIPALAADHRVVAVDLKGFGYSERVQTGLSHTDQVAMLRALLDELAIDRATFVGHSMGGAVVQRFAATYPDRVHALVLAATMPADLRFRGRLPVPAFLLRPFIPVLGRFAADRLLEASFHDSSKLTPDLRAHYRKPERIKGSMDGLLAMLNSASADDPVDLARITQPTLLLYAADDKIAPLRLGQQIRERIPHARMVVVDRAGHLLFDEQPQDSLNAIRDFLRDTAPSASPQTAHAQ